MRAHEEKRAKRGLQLIEKSKNEDGSLALAITMEEEDKKVKNEALQIIRLHQNLPSLIVFDLDHTLWPLYW